MNAYRIKKYIGSYTGIMNGLGDEVFPYPGLPLQQDTRIGTGDLVDLGQHVPVRIALSD